jgi:hypothetical protein
MSSVKQCVMTCIRSDYHRSDRNLEAEGGAVQHASVDKGCGLKAGLLAKDNQSGNRAIADKAAIARSLWICGTTHHYESNAWATEIGCASAAGQC